MLTLWDLIDPVLLRLAGGPKAKPGAKVVAKVAPAAAAPPKPARKPRERSVGQSTTKAIALVGREPAAVRVRPPAERLGRGEAADAPMQAKYDAVVELMLEKHQVRVRKWRKTMSGVAWYVTYRDGRRVNLIESPRPKGPMSAAVFLHEIGHHAIGFDVYKPRCLEEFHAWRWSLEAMEACGLNITDAVRLRMHRSLHYAVAKAKRRGIKKIPVELEPFLVKPPARKRRAVA